MRYFFTILFWFYTTNTLAAVTVDKSTVTLSSSGSSETIIVTNDGKREASLNLTVTGSHLSDFTVGSPANASENCSTKLAGGSSCKFTVTFNSQGSGERSATINLAEGVVITLKGTGQTGPVPPTTVTLTVTKPGTGQGTITSTPAGIDCGPSCNFNNFEANNPVTLTATADSTSDFAGWSPADKCPSSTTSTCTLTLTANSTVTATFNLKATPKVTLTVTKAGSGTGQVKSDPPGIDCGVTCPQQQFETTANTTVTLTATPDLNSTFVGWTGGDCSGNSTCPVTMNAAKTVTATFTPNQPSLNEVSLNVTIDGSGKVKCNANDCQPKYPQNTPVTLIATPDSGFDFSKWSGDCTGTVGPTCTLPMSKSDNQATAYFTPTPPPTSTTPTPFFPLTVKPTTGEVKCDGATCNPQYPQGTAVTLTAIPKPGDELANWEGCTPNPADPKVCSVTMDSAKTVTAHFIVSNVPVTPLTPVTPATTSPLTVNPTTGEVKYDGATCNPQYPQGTSVTLTAMPKPGYEFARWEGCTPTPTDPKICVVTMDSPKIVTATFNFVSQPVAAQSFPLQVYLTGPGKVLCDNVECLPTQTYTVNTPVTLTAVPTPGNTFTGWTGACTGNIVPCQLTMSEAKTVSATFELPPPPPPAQPVMMIHVAPTCATDSISISDTCKGQGKSLACNVTIERSANLSKVLFACDATNRGWIANSTIQTGVTVTGGVFTGYITNQGTLADFEFRGASITGGTLSGKIVNKSKVGGYFKDVHLAARTYITGGTVTGTITGDCQIPATLENLKVKAGSHLSCVEFGKNVKLEKNVTVEKPK